MRILYTIAGLYRPAGMERILTDKVNYLADKGYDIIIVTTEQKGRPCAFPLLPQIRHLDLGVGYEDNNGSSLWDKLVHFPAKQRKHRKSLTQVLLKEHPDTVISLFCGDERFLYRMKDGSRKVLEVHFSRLKRIQYGRRGLWSIVDRWRSIRDLKLVRRYDYFVCLTNEDFGYWGHPANGRVIPNFLNHIPQEPSPLSAKTVLSVGRYDYQKGYDRLIRAWASIPDKGGWTLRLVGNGPLRQDLQRLSELLCVGESVIVDEPQSDMAAVYRNASIFTLSSHYEGLPMVLLEAQSYGLPIVSFNCKCGPRDVIADGEDGYLVPEGDIPCLAARIAKLMADSRLREEMGEKARAKAPQWDKETIMRQWIQLLRE